MTNFKKRPSIACGYECSFVCNDGDVFVWGDNSHYQLGLPKHRLTDKNFHIVKENKFFKKKHLNVTSIAGYYRQTFFLTSNGKVFCVGSNSSGQLGVGDTKNREKLTLVNNVKKVRIVKVSTGDYHTLFLSSVGDVFGCGRTSGGQLGPRGQRGGAIKKVEKLILKLNSKERIRDICCGSSFSFFVTSENRYICCGSNSNGELGITKRGSSVSVFTDGNKLLKGKTKVCSGGYDHSLFLTMSGDVYGSGNSTKGQFGAYGRRGLTKMNIDNNKKFRYVFAGVYSSYYIDVKGNLYISGAIIRIGLKLEERKRFIHLKITSSVSNHFSSRIAISAVGSDTHGVILISDERREIFEVLTIGKNPKFQLGIKNSKTGFSKIPFSFIHRRSDFEVSLLEKASKKIYVDISISVMN